MGFTVKRFKTLYLHIGLGKTGTTSVQADLLAKAAELEASHDLHYPSHFPHEPHFRGNHSRLLRTLFADSENVRRRLAARGLVTEEAIANYNRKTLDCLHKSFSGAKASRLLLSAEAVGHFAGDDMLALAELLGGFADEVRVIACLRHPAHALSSEIQQRLNIGDTLENLYSNPPSYRFKSLFERVEQAFGTDAVVVYDFAAARESQRGLTWVLFDQLGIDVGDMFALRPPVNTSISHEAALLISALNRRRPLVVDGVPNPLRQDNAMQKMMKIPGRKFSAPAEVYDKVQARVQSDLDWLQRHYQLRLQAGSLPPAVDEKHFSDESIEALALQMADLARFRSRVLSPWSTLTGRVRAGWQKLF